MNHSQRKSYWIVAGALLLIFCAGQGIGFLWAARLADRDAQTDPATAWSERWAEQTLGTLRNDLNLTESQTAAIEPLLQSTGNRIWKERRRALFQIHLNILEVHDEIEKHLADNQINGIIRSREMLQTRIQREFPEIIENMD